MASEGTHSMIERMIRASRLAINMYEEGEADTSATNQALLIVALVALATGIASLGTTGPIGLLVGVVLAIAGWALWAWIVHLIGTKIIPSHSTHADWGK